MKEIPLTRGFVALVDDEDFERISQYKWHAQVRQTTQYGKRVHYPKGGGHINIMLHRFILNAPDNMQVDHIDGNGLNNQRSNLRLCTQSQNQRNRPATRNNQSGYKGVSRRVKRRLVRWASMIQSGGRLLFLGVFKTPEEAARAYDRKARELHGEFARLNFPNEA